MLQMRSEFETIIVDRKLAAADDGVIQPFAHVLATWGHIGSEFHPAPASIGPGHLVALATIFVCPSARKHENIPRVRHEADQRSDRPLLRLGRLWCLRDRHEVEEDVAIRQVALELRRAAAELLGHLPIEHFNHPARLHRKLASDHPLERAGKGLELVEGLAVWVPVAQPGVRYKEHWRHALLPLDQRARIAELLVRAEHLEGRRQQRLDRQDKHGEAPLQRGVEKGIAGVAGLAAVAAPERRRQLCRSRLLRYRRGGRTGIYLHCRTQQSHLILQFCDLLRLRVELCALRVELCALRVELCALRVELCAQECLETAEPVGIGAGGAGDGQGPRGHARGVVLVLPQPHAPSWRRERRSPAPLARRHARARVAGPAAACRNHGRAARTAPASLSSRDAVGWRQLRSRGR
eukprot:scaffold19443_cov66-Phaeocystis_antarctica.AAC.2